MLCDFFMRPQKLFAAVYFCAVFVVQTERKNFCSNFDVFFLWIEQRAFWNICFIDKLNRKGPTKAKYQNLKLCIYFLLEIDHLYGLLMDHKKKCPYVILKWGLKGASTLEIVLTILNITLLNNHQYIVLHMAENIEGKYEEWVSCIILVGGYLSILNSGICTIRHTKGPGKCVGL